MRYQPFNEDLKESSRINPLASVREEKTTEIDISKVKKMYLTKKLDLLDDNNYQNLVRVFRKDGDRKAEQSVERAR